MGGGDLRSMMPNRSRRGSFSWNCIILEYEYMYRHTTLFYCSSMMPVQGSSMRFPCALCLQVIVVYKYRIPRQESSSTLRVEECGIKGVRVLLDRLWGLGQLLVLTSHVRPIAGGEPLQGFPIWEKLQQFRSYPRAIFFLFFQPPYVLSRLSFTRPKRSRAQVTPHFPLIFDDCFFPFPIPFPFPFRALCSLCTSAALAHRLITYNASPALHEPQLSPIVVT